MITSEIWMLAGNGWTHPAWVRWDEEREFCRVEFAPWLSRKHGVGPPKKHEKRQMEWDLRRVAEKMGARIWKFHRATLEIIGQRIDAWENPNLELEDHDDNKDLQEMVEAFAKKSRRTKTETAWWFSQFCNAMADRLINENKSVDIMFARLHPSFYRRNWKNVVLGLASGSASESEITAMFRANELLEVFEATVQGARKAIARLHIELEERPTWRRETERAEWARRLAGSKNGGFNGGVYIRHVQRCVRAQIKTAIRLFHRWRLDIAQPCGRLDPCAHPFSPRLVSARAMPVEFLKRFSAVIVSPMVALSLRAKSYCLQRDLRAKDGRLSEVFPLRPPCADVRDGGANVSGSNNGKSGNAGMLVPHAGKSVAAGKLLEVGRGRPKRVARIVEPGQQDYSI